jgi:hypothetical protein
MDAGLSKKNWRGGYRFSALNEGCGSQASKSVVVTFMTVFVAKKDSADP